MIDENKDLLNPQQQPSNEKENFSSMSAPGTPTRPEDVKVSCGTEGKWPCANCHAMVSEDRCPFCHGIQVKIKNDEAARSLSEAWIERVSPATIRGPGSPLSSHRAGKLVPFVQRMILDDNEVVEIDEDDEEELEQTSESSPRYDIEEDEFVGRPNNPVAVLLATADSPLPKFELPENRQDIKQQSKDRVQDGTGAGKKQRILFAM